MEFYVIAEYPDGSYEIAMSEYTDIGRQPSEERAILWTKETKITLNGWAQMNVYQTGKKDVQLKDEHGSFTQQWKIYEEASEYDLAAAELLVTEIESTQKELQDASSKLNKMRSDMYQICINGILPVYDAITSLKSQVIQLNRQSSIRNWLNKQKKLNY